LPPLDLPDADKAVTIDQIVDRIECEVYWARHNNPALQRSPWTVSASLSLTVNDGAGLTPTVSFITPLKTAGTSYKFSASAELSRTRERIFQETIIFNVAKARRDKCHSDSSESYDYFRPRPRLAIPTSWTTGSSLRLLCCWQSPFHQRAIPVKSGFCLATTLPAGRRKTPQRTPQARFETPPHRPLLL
jgi:hypothetical protein